MAGIVLLSIPIFLVLLAAEWLSFRLRPDPALRGYETADALCSLSMGLGNVFVSALWKTVAVGVLFAAYEWRVFTVPVDAPWAWAVALIGDDFFYYWFHRFGHRTRLGWAAHVNHHSSEYYNLSTALRQSWTGPLLKVWFYVPLVLLGIHPLMVLTCQAISLLYQFWIHTERIGRLPRPLEWVFNTPSHHRVHHGSNPQYLDRNYAGILIIWDRLFGTFTPEQERVHYGLTYPFPSRNPVWVAFHEWVAMLRDASRAATWRERLAFLVMPPGWSPPRPDPAGRERAR